MFFQGKSMSQYKCTYSKHYTNGMLSNRTINRSFTYETLDKIKEIIKHANSGSLQHDHNKNSFRFKRVKVVNVSTGKEILSSAH
jgi:hypothetical protein